MCRRCVAEPRFCSISQTRRISTPDCSPTPTRRNSAASCWMLSRAIRPSVVASGFWRDEFDGEPQLLDFGDRRLGPRPNVAKAPARPDLPFDTIERPGYQFGGTSMVWKSVAIVGVGLLGASIGLALRERRLAEQVVGIGLP